jgi:hypothetical protein
VKNNVVIKESTIHLGGQVMMNDSISYIVAKQPIAVCNYLKKSGLNKKVSDTTKRQLSRFERYWWINCYCDVCGSISLARIMIGLFLDNFTIKEIVTELIPFGDASFFNL